MTPRYSQQQVPPLIARAFRAAVLPSDQLRKIQTETGQAPMWTPIRPRAVREAIDAHGADSDAAREAERIAGIARRAYVMHCKGEPYDPADLQAPEFWPVMQERVLYRKESEILCGGSKGSSKSETCRMWIVSGDPYMRLVDTAGRVDLTALSYVYNPEFYAVVIRRNAKDLDEWVMRSRPYYNSAFGTGAGEDFWREGAQMFQFPQWNARGEVIGKYGARIVLAHLGDSGAHQALIGKQVQRALVEELIEIETALYEETVAVVRSTVTGIRSQIMANTNPPTPESPGEYATAVYERFIEPCYEDSKGRKVPILDSKGNRYNAFQHDSKTPKYPEEAIRVPIDQDVVAELGVPGLEIAYATRVFIPGRITDNPYLLRDKTYIAKLATMPKASRDALLFGYWNVTGGAFFKGFRPKGPLPGEPANANHVIAPRPLQRWWHRWLAMDWGFEHECVVYEFAHDQSTGQIHVCNEMIFTQTVPELVGGTLGRYLRDRVLPGIPGGCITLYAGADIEQNRTGRDRSVIELLAAGLQQALPGMVHAPDYLLLQIREEALARGEHIDPAAERRILEARQRGVTIRRVNTSHGNRAVGAQMIRSMLNWIEVDSGLADGSAGFDPSHALGLLMEGTEESEQELQRHVYASMPRLRRAALPRLQIWLNSGPRIDGVAQAMGCPGLVEAIPKLRHHPRHPEMVDDKHFLGLDRYDALRHGILGFREEENAQPFDARVGVRMAEYREAHPDASTGQLIRAHDGFERQEQARDAAPAVAVMTQTRRRMLGARFLQLEPLGAYSDNR